MQIFIHTLKQILSMFCFIMAGFVLKKKNILADNANVVLSKVLLYVVSPALSLYTQMKRCTVETFTESYVLILYGFAASIAAILLSYPLSKLFVRNYKESSALSYQREIFKYGLSFANISYFGNFLILGVWGEEMLFKYQLLTMFPVIACQVWGLYILIPKEKGITITESLKKGLLNPPVIALIAGMILGITGLAKFVPDFIMTAFNNAGVCQGPIAMLIGGFVIGGYSLKELLTNKKVYLASTFRLVLIPGVFVLILKALGASDEVATFVLISFAASFGLNTVVYPSAFGGDPKTGASMATISNILVIATLPLMYLVFVVLM